MATESEREIFASEVLAAIGANAAKLPARELVGFLAMQGRQYKRELMVVGRAVNGWSGEFYPEDMISPNRREDYAEAAYNHVRGGTKCPMTWVTGCWSIKGKKYNSHKSAFWRVIRQVLIDLRLPGADGDTWPSLIVWSNLYKVSPAEGGNPSPRLRRIQCEGCRKLLKVELQQHKPKRLLFLTGWDWASKFVNEMGPDLKRINGKCVHATGQFHIAPDVTMRAVVAAHPQRKARGVTERAFVDEVVNGFGGNTFRYINS